ncbi:CysPc [Aspergillus sclerotialis]|uniref:CysPc n=1 Tax=Aspergillus sclerotialis TaxID=2070753 RepID=A0A3A2ZM98_9EURO|nr:CysPc [Aspergillus sclerotialis]
MSTPFIPAALAPAPTPIPKKDSNKPPQDIISDFWDKFLTKNPSRVTKIFPEKLYTNLLEPLQEKVPSTSQNAAQSYETAARQCKEQVARIVRECKRMNEKFSDPDFDIESDKDLCQWNCLRGLVRGSAGSGSQRFITRAGTDSGSCVCSDDEGDDDDLSLPGSVHRVDWIFERPEFVIDGYSNTDIKQGANGDCWWLAAVATICNRQDLIERVCVARDEECGVYGFLFYRDGEWESTIVDDNLYLTSEDFDFYGDRYDSTGKRAREHKKRHQTGSEALHFAKCSDPNETWLPLLEKAYAKIHGDYGALSGGWCGEAVEDMTGGVTTTIATNRVLNKNRLWNELVDSESNFVFAASALGTGLNWTRGGLPLGHAYSILRATEEVDEDGNKVRLVLIRNPWGERDQGGKGEWNGPWSDGSREWTPYWLQKLQYKFGDDGIWWMEYQDMLSTFMLLHRTRVFNEKWTVVQKWTSVSVPWITGYLKTKFVVEIERAGLVVFVLSQVDKRYFRGLDGQFNFSLHFLLQEENAKPGEHIALVRPAHCNEYRSISAEVELDPGKYEVLLKVIATRDSKKKMVEDVVKDCVEKNPEKLKQVGMNYDLANSKNESKKNPADDQKNDTKEEKNGKAILQGELPASKNGEPAVEFDKGNATGCTSKEVDTGVVVHHTGDRRSSQDNGQPQHVDRDSTELQPTEKHELTVKQHGSEDKTKSEATDEKSPDKNDAKDTDNNDNKEGEKLKTEPQAPEIDHNEPLTWNAVCVLGLRVYAMDPEVTIELVKSNDA